MSQTFNDQAIVLRKQNIAEADRLYTLLTKAHGKIKAVAKGSRKIQSKLAGHLEPFSLVDLMIANGRYWAKLANSKLVKTYQPEDLTVFGLFNLWTEVIDSLVKEETSELEIFQLSLDFYSQLSKNSNNRSLVLNYYLLRLLSQLGYQPELYRCTHCKERIEAKNNHFCFQLGGLVCSKCLPAGHKTVKVNDNLVKLLRLILVEKFSDFSKIKIDRLLEKKLADLIFQYLRYYFEKEIKSEEFLKQLYDH